MDTDTWHRPFEITSVCREDLRSLFSETDIARLDDRDMREIASKMEDAYCDGGFWIDLQIMVEHVLSEKDEEQARR